MSRCRACNKRLTEKEDAAYFEKSKERVGLCTYDAAWLPADVSIVGLDVHSRIPEELPPLDEEEDWDDGRYDE